MGFKRLVMAMIIAKIKDYKIQVSVAGMPFPLIYRAASGEVKEIPISGMPLGSFADFPYQSQRLSVKKDDTLLLMSDGFQEMFKKIVILGSFRSLTPFQASQWQFQIRSNRLCAIIGQMIYAFRYTWRCEPLQMAAGS